MTIAINLLLFALSCTILLVSGSLFIKALLKITSFLKMSVFVVSFIIVGIATSLPELLVGINSAIASLKDPLSNAVSLSLGNVIGSNIANLTIIVGIPLLLAKGITVGSKTTKKDSFYMLIIALLPLLLMLIGKTLSRIDGFILIVVFFLYCTWLIRKNKEFSKQTENHIGRWEIVINVFLFIFSALLLYFSAEYTVKYAIRLSIDLALPTIFIGLFIVALGTSLPELVVGFQAALKKNHDIILGNIMGSVVANSTLVLGITALIFPITSDLLVFFVSIGFMIVAASLFTIFVESGKRMHWMNGVVLIFVYIIFIIVEMYMKGIHFIV